MTTSILMLFLASCIFVDASMPLKGAGIAKYFRPGKCAAFAWQMERTQAKMEKFNCVPEPTTTAIPTTPEPTDPTTTAIPTTPEPRDCPPLTTIKEAGLCALFAGNQASFSNAETLCAFQSARLVVLDTADKVQAVVDLLSRLNAYSEAWVGATRNGDGTLSWSTGGTVENAQLDVNGNCGKVNQAGVVTTDICTTGLAYVCDFL